MLAIRRRYKCVEKEYLWYIEQFSNDCLKTNTKVTIPTNHERSKQLDEPIRIPVAVSCNLCEGKIARTRCKWFSFGFGFGFASHVLKNWRDISKSICKRCNRIRVVFSTVIWKLLKYGLYNRATFHHCSSSLTESLMNERLVFKETLSPRRWECETSKYGIKQFGKGKISTMSR